MGSPSPERKSRRSPRRRTRSRSRNRTGWRRGKGNVPQVIRILPYSTAMLNSYEFYKQQFGGDEYREHGTLPATCLSISPYSALNFCAFDLIKKAIPGEETAQ